VSKRLDSRYVERLLDRHALCAAASITSPSRGDPCWQTLVGLRVESVLRINQHYHDSAETEITTIFSRPTASSPASSNVLVAKRRAGARCQINLLTRPGR
jgi:hypothetical protein